MTKGVQINIKGEQEGQGSPPSPGGLACPLIFFVTVDTSLFLFSVSAVWEENIWATIKPTYFEAR